MNLFTRKKQENDDENAARELRQLLSQASVEEIERFVDGTLLSCTIAQEVFRSRFPKQFNAWREKAKMTMVAVDGEKI